MQIEFLTKSKAYIISKKKKNSKMALTLCFRNNSGFSNIASLQCSWLYSLSGKEIGNPMATHNLQSDNTHISNSFCQWKEIDTWYRVMQMVTFPHGDKILCLCQWKMTELHIQQVEDFFVVVSYLITKIFVSPTLIDSKNFQFLC